MLGSGFDALVLWFVANIVMFLVIPGAIVYVIWRAFKAYGRRTAAMERAVDLAARRGE